MARKFVYPFAKKQEEDLDLSEIRSRAKVRHERERRNAKKRGRVNYPLLPYECSWAYEIAFEEKRRCNMN